MAKTYQGTKLQDLGNLEVLDPTDKIVIVKPKDEGVMELKEFFFYVQQNLDLSNYYTTTQANARFAEKSVVYTKGEADARFAFLDRVYSKVQSDTKYALKDDTFTKDEADIRYAGIDFSYSKTDLYTKDETFRTFALKTEILPPVDLSPYSTTDKGDMRWAMKNETYTKIDSDARFAPLERSYAKAEADGRFAKVITTYTKEETDSKFIDVDEGYTRTFIQNNIYFKPELYTRLESDNRFALKNNVYTIAAINEQFASKAWVYSRGDAEATFAPIATTYTKTEINTLLDSRINPVSANLATNYYNKDNTDTKFATKALTYSRVESDGKYALISNTLTELQLIAKYYDKTEVDAKFSAIDWTPYLTKTAAADTYATKDTTLTKTAIQTSYYTKAQVDDAIAAAEQGLETGSAERYVTSAYAEERYANVDSVYTKTESDGKYATLALTYSRIDSDARYFVKGEVTTAINDKATQTLGTVATNYLSKTDAANTYITIANANNTLANKTTVYTKTESDARYAPKDSSYLKAVSDSRYLKVGLDTLSVINTGATGSGAVLNLNNTHADNLESGRIVWNNETHSIGNLRITNTATKEAYFTLDLRPNFVTNPVKALTVTPTYIEHGSYGKLHTYFAIAESVYTKPIIDSLLSEIRADYVTTSAANSRFALASDHSTLNATVTTLSNRVTTDRTYLDSNYYKKTEVYTKVESDAKYYNSSTSNLIVSGSGTNVALSINATGSGYKTGNLNFNFSGDKVSSIYSSLNSTDAALSRLVFTITNTEKTGTTDVMTLTRSGINHVSYGDLHTYFAKSSETYTKTEADAKFSSSANAVYTKAESDGRYPSKGEFTTLTGRVTTEEGKLTALTTNLSNNYYAKTLVYTKTESDGRYVSSKSNVITLAPNAGDTNTLALHIAAPTGATTLGGIKWSRGSDVYTLNALIDGENKGKLQFGKVSGSSVLAYFVATDTGLWHTGYGDLHTYFAKRAEHYSKTEADGRYYTKTESDTNYHNKTVTYTRTEMDGRYSQIINTYTKTESDANFAPKALTYLKTESDGRYPLATNVYTKSESDGKYALNTAGYTKVESDTRYHQKSVTYTRTESDARYINYSDTLITVTGNKTTGDGLGIVLSNTNTTSLDTPLLEFRHGTERTGYLYYYGKGTAAEIRFNIGVGTTGRALAVSNTGIWHKSYGDLHTYFAKASDVYTKVEAEARYQLKSTSYTKVETDAKFYDTTQANARFALRADDYTKIESDARYYQKTVVYTKTEADARYEYKGVAYTKAQSDSSYYAKSAQLLTVNSANTNTVGTGIVLNNNNTSGKTSNISFNNNGVNAGFIYVTRLDATESVMSFHNTNAAGTSVESLKITNGGLSHSAYGDLHTYFAKSAEYYSKVEADARYPLKAASYTKAEADARYYDMTQANARFALKTDGYTKAEADGRYYQKTVVYTKAETDAKFYDMVQADVRYVLKADVYTKAQSDTNYHNKTVTYTRTEMDARYPLKADSYTKAEGDTRYLLKTDGYTRLESDGKYPLKTASYTKAESDARYYDTTQANARFEYVGVAYTKAQSDTNYYTKAQSDANYYTKAVGDGRYEYKNVAYTKAVSDGKYEYKGVAYAKAESDTRYYQKADVYSKTELAGIIQAADTRTTNENPQWYVTNYPGREAREFKTATTIGVPGVTGYAGLTTNFTYNDTSGGLPTQMVHASNNKLFIRAGASTTAWSSWLELESVTGADSKYYTKAVSDGRYEYMGVAYTKAVSDGKYALKTDAYTKAEGDARYYQKADVYTKAQSDANYYTKAVGDGRYEYTGVAYTKAQSDANYHNKTVTYTRTEMDSRYYKMVDNLIVITDATSSTDGTGLRLDTTHATRTTTPLLDFTVRAVRSGCLFYTTNTDKSSFLTINLANNLGTQINSVKMTHAGIWHNAYGDLHTYFAKAADVYSKAAGDARYEYKSVAYTKAQSDANYYTKAVGDGRYEYKSVAYTKAQSDANYYNKTVTYTRTEMDGRYPLKAASYTKAESDANYYTKTVSDGRYAKVWSGTQAQYNAVATKDAKTIYIIT